MQNILKDYRGKYENCLLTGEEFDFDGLETELQAWADDIKEDLEAAKDELEDLKGDPTKLITALTEARESKKEGRNRYLKQPYSGELADNLLDLVDNDSIESAFKKANPELYVFEIRGMDARTKLEEFLSTELYPFYNDIREIL